MELQVKSALHGFVTNNDAGGDISVGPKLSDKDFSGGAAIGLGGAGENGGAIFLKPSVGYNSDAETPSYHDGTYGKLEAKFSSPFSGPKSFESVGGTTSSDGSSHEVKSYSVEGGYRFNSDKKYHENVGGYTDYVKKDDGSSLVRLGAESEIVTKNNGLYLKTGLESSSAKSGISPCFGLGVRFSLFPNANSIKTY